MDSDRGLPTKNIFFKIPSSAKKIEGSGLPAETNVVSSETPVQTGIESTVKKLTVTRAKTLIREGEPTEEKEEWKPLSPETEAAFQGAKDKKEEYENIVTCYGEKHVTPTFVTVGETVGDTSPRPHIYQEPVSENSLSNLFGLDDLEKIFLKPAYQRLNRVKELGLAGLKKYINAHSESSDLSWEKKVLNVLEKHQKAFQEFYPAYVEGLLLGYCPDIQRGIESDSVRGILFNDNLGINVSSGTETVQVYDFGIPGRSESGNMQIGYNILPLHSRQKLRALIDSHKAQSDLPIYRTGDTSMLAPWYEEALKTELEKTIEDPNFKLVGVNVTIDHVYIKNSQDAVDALLQHIKQGVGIFADKDGNPITFRTEDQEKYFRDLESFQRLCDAKPYGTEAKISEDGKIVPENAPGQVPIKPNAA